MPPVAPKKKEKEKKAPSYWDMLMAEIGQTFKPPPKPAAKPKPVAVVVAAPPKQDYGIGQTGVINDTATWNPVIEKRPELPLPTPAMLPLDLKRRTATISGYTDEATEKLYQTPLSYQPYHDGDHLGLYERTIDLFKNPFRPDEKITVWTNPEIDSVSTLQHEFAHATEPTGLEAFQPSLNDLAARHSDIAQGAIADWEWSKSTYPGDYKTATSELYARFAQGLNNDPEYRRSQVPKWFMDMYYPGMYK